MDTVPCLNLTSSIGSVAYFQKKFLPYFMSIQSFFFAHNQNQPPQSSTPNYLHLWKRFLRVWELRQDQCIRMTLVLTEIMGDAPQLSRGVQGLTLTQPLLPRPWIIISASKDDPPYVTGVIFEMGSQYRSRSS